MDVFCDPLCRTYIPFFFFPVFRSFFFISSCTRLLIVPIKLYSTLWRDADARVAQRYNELLFSSKIRVFHVELLILAGCYARYRVTFLKFTWSRVSSFPVFRSACTPDLSGWSFFAIKRYQINNCQCSSIRTTIDLWSWWWWWWWWLVKNGSDKTSLSSTLHGKTSRRLLAINTRGWSNGRDAWCLIFCSPRRNDVRLPCGKRWTMFAMFFFFFFFEGPLGLRIFHITCGGPWKKKSFFF